MKISFNIHTASHDNFLENQGINSYFQAVIDNLSRQTFKDFEFIYIDTFHEDNQEIFKPLIETAPFQIKHVPLHQNHRYWHDKGYTYISAAKNTGILYADGELVISCDDGEFFPDDLLEKYWCYHECGHYMHAFHKRMRSIQTVDGRLKFPIDGDIYINDPRLLNATKDINYHSNGVWTYAGTSFKLSDAIKLNGFNERMDAYKSLEDCDFGIRLVLLGRKLVMDKSGFLYILDHTSYVDAPRKKKISEFVAIENHGVLRCATELFELEANKYPITDKHLKIIQRETLKYRHFDPLAEDNKEKMNIWLNTPTFNLKAERAALRNNDWKWK